MRSSSRAKPLKPINQLASSLLAAIIFWCAADRADAMVGATTPFISYEAEAGTLGGGATAVSLTSAPTTPYSSPQLEASGHAYVQLISTGQSVTWTNSSSQNFTAINLRSCIPDAPAGGGITNTIDLYVNGIFRQTLSVNSLQNYCYEGTNYNGQTDKNPADGDPRGFWNDTHAFITGAAVAPGSTLTLQKDATNSAAFYDIDVVDLENPPAPLSQPANSLSITSYGAISNNLAFDNTSAFNNCFTAAEAQGKSVWIPPGTFYISAINGGLNASGITIQGAGSWYSTIYRVTAANNSQGVNNLITTTSCTLQNVALDCNSSSRAGNNNNGAINFSGNNWLVNNVWIQHVTSAFWCAGVGGTAENCRVLSVWSDGGNFNNVQSANGIGMNLTYSNNFVRGTGDDAMAINSVNYNGTTYYTMMSNIVYVNNTTIDPWGGKNMGIYGGKNDLVANNLLSDSARYLGLGVGRFGVNGSDLLSATVTNNIILRGGGNGYSQQQQGLMIGNSADGQGVGTVANVYCANNIISNSLFGGMAFSTSSNIVFQYNTIINPGSSGIILGPTYAGSGIVGNAILNSNTITGLGTGQAALTNSALGYAAITPIIAASYNDESGAQIENCSEGGFDVSYPGNGAYTAYNNISFSNVNTFVVRLASANDGGNLEIHLDSPTGTLIGTCTVTGTGGSQVWANSYCAITNATGTHTVYLVTSGMKNSLAVEFFGLFTASLETSHQLIPGNTYALNALIDNKYVDAANGGTNPLIADSSSIGLPEEFEVFDAGGGNIALLALVNGQYVCADNNGASPLIANRSAFGSWETYTEYAADHGNIALRAMNNGQFVSAPNSGNSPLIASSSTIGSNQTFAVQFVSGVAPTVPNGLMATPDNRQVTLSWVASTSATSYTVAVSTSSSGSYTVVAANVTNTSYTDDDLVNGTTYYFVVSAQNPAGNSGNSSSLSVVPGTWNRTFWIASSSTAGSDSPANALDGNVTTRWSTGTSQVNGQWFQVDMGFANVFNTLVLNSVSSANDYPRGYQVIVSNDGINWSSPIATGTGTSSTTTITFAAQTARYIRIIQTGSAAGTYWSIDEFNVLGTSPLAPTNLTATVFGNQASLAWSASVAANGYNLKRATNGGTLEVIATNLSALTYTDSGLIGGTTYYYVVTATNTYGESANSIQAKARAISTTLPPVSFLATAGQMQLSWPLDHLGWNLEAQTDSASAGLGTNWVIIPNSNQTNQMTIPIASTNGSVFFRLAYP